MNGDERIEELRNGLLKAREKALRLIQITDKEDMKVIGMILLAILDERLKALAS